MAMNALVAPMSFTKVTADHLDISGVVVGGIALISLTWSGSSAFTSSGWGDTKLATFSGWTAVHEIHAPMIDNQSGDGAGVGMLHVYGNGVYFRTKCTVDISNGAWHMGCVAVPVVPA